MTSCWNADVNMRPKFVDLAKTFEELLEKSSQNYGYLMTASRRNSQLSVHDDTIGFLVHEKRASYIWVHCLSAFLGICFVGGLVTPYANHLKPYKPLTDDSIQVGPRIV
ncbi:hypothetical protein L596_010646 [Steinernema carpocapsae]|uniref:Serine-threonine/tyrosine-protein kinase catalytic domain-containing protein n=1 Tax=Steinernema carpocapsae TaxID=34508 RepID=A0A4U5PJ37_STECR|nr:hypothetical protein L596_010646 [Steinernema carpocapsae]